MRLIDADKLIDNLDEMILADDGGDYAMGIATAIQEVGRMAFYEEVKAIQIEWIEKKCRELYEDLYLDEALGVQRLLREWEKENEERTNT